MALDYDHRTENLGSHFIFHIQSTLLLKKAVHVWDPSCFIIISLKTDQVSLTLTTTAKMEL